MNEISSGGKQTDHEQLRVLHLFSSYPGSNTTNWLYNLITNTPGTHAIIAAEYFSRHNFYSTDFTYIESPSASVNHYKNQLPNRGKYLIDKIICVIAEKLLGGLKKQINAKYKKLDVTLAHAHFADVGCTYVDFIKNKNLPLLVSFYGYDYEYLPHIKPEYIKRYQDLFFKADKFVCEGSHGAGILLRMGCPKEKIAVIHLGVEVEKIPFQLKTRQPGTLSLLQIASIREKKGHIYTLKAFHKALAKCPAMHLTFVGGGEAGIENQLREYISSNDLTDKVTLIHEIDFNKLHNFISGFDVFIHPSCYSSNKDCEGGAPVVLLDAQACGIPVISTTHCDIPDEVLQSKTGLLTPEKDVNALAGSIDYFYNMDATEYEAYSMAARRHVEENYSIKKNTTRLKELYNSLL